jgi:Myosin-like coiled-coil protein
MKKRDRNPRDNKKQPLKNEETTPAPPVSKAKNLSLIFSKLAEFEDQRLDEDFSRLTGDEGNFVAPTVDINEELLRLNTIIEGKFSAEEQLRMLYNIFQEKLNMIKELEAAIPPSLATCRATYKKKDLMILESLRLKHDIDLSTSTYKEKADLCRNLQVRNKEYEATTQLLLIEEAKKTEELRAKCMDSIVSVTKQVEDEEAIVLAKKEENDSLSDKIMKFNSHLVIRDEHLETQRKAREVEQQLLNAKTMQYIRAEEQRTLDSKSYGNHILQLASAQKDLEGQVELYVEKASSFEKTLEDTKSVFQQFEDRATTMIREVEEIEAEVRKQEAVKADKKMKLLKMMSYVTAANKKIEEMGEEDRLANYCRKLQSRRTELTKDLARLSATNVLQEDLVDVNNSLRCQTTYKGSPEGDDLLDDRPSEEVIDIRSGRSSPHLPDACWVPSVLSSSSGRSCSTPPSSSSRNWTETAAKENTAGEDTPVSSPSVHSPKRVSGDDI